MVGKKTMRATIQIWDSKLSMNLRKRVSMWRIRIKEG
jgi:hypothetical protein